MGTPDAPTLVPDLAVEGHTRRLGAGLIGAPLAYLGAVALMGLVFASDPPPRLVGHLDEFTAGLGLYQWGFVGASLLAPTLVTTLVLLLAVARVPADAARRWVGSILLGAYLVLATIAYTSQYTFLPGLVERDPAGAELWYLHDATSITYSLDLAGYALLGLGAIVLAPALRSGGVRLRWIARSLVAMGALSLAAFGFHAASLDVAASVATITSALCTLPVMGLAISVGRRLYRERED